MTDPIHPALGRHFDAWLGGRPTADGTIRVVGCSRRSEPGWDGRLHPLVGVVTPAGGIVSVPPAAVDGVAEALSGQTPESVADPARGGTAGPWAASMAAAMGRPDARVINGVFRWTVEPADLPDAGVWVPVDAPVVPRWLKPFGGEVLLALDDGAYVAGVGLKRHDPTGEEIAVVTEEPARGRGLARRLVSQAARRVVDRGAVVTTCTPRTTRRRPTWPTRPASRTTGGGSWRWSRSESMVRGAGAAAQGPERRYCTYGRTQRPRGRAGAMRDRAADRLLPRRLLQHRAGGCR